MHVRQITIVLLFFAAMAFASGCAHEMTIPGSATMVDHGQGRLGYVPHDNGMVYLFDSSAKKPVFSSHILRDDKITIDPDLDLIAIAGTKTEHKPPLNPDHVYRLFFDKDS